MSTPLKVALVVDWLTEGFGGGERVIKAVHDLYPDAPIYTSQYRPKRTTWLGVADVRVGWLNVFPARLKRFIPFLRQFYFSHLDLSDYDVVISITGAEAKAVRTSGDTLHVSYVHAPTQYYWTLYDQYIESPGFGVLNPLARLGLKLLVRPLRRADYQAAQNPDVVIANSSYVQAEIKKFYHRESQVVWPNVDVAAIQKIKPASNVREGFIITGRQVSWKRIDLAIQAASETGQKLTIVGDGPEHTRLVALAEGKPDIVFLPRYAGVHEIIEHLRAARGFIFPSLEPFGIAPVEALAAGTPVIALKKGGALDFVTDGENGVFFEEQTVKSVSEAITSFNAMTFDEATVEKSAAQFSEANFKAEFQKIISDNLKRKVK